MCGIIAGVAVIGPRTKITNGGTYERAKALTERLNHRGPDDIGVHIGKKNMPYKNMTSFCSIN